MNSTRDRKSLCCQDRADSAAAKRLGGCCSLCRDEVGRQHRERRGYECRGRKRSAPDPGSLGDRLGDRDAGGGGAGGKRHGSLVGQLTAVDREHAESVDSALIDVQRPTVRAQPGVDRADACLRADLGGAQQRQRAVRGDRVARDAARSRVDREQELAVVADLDPAWRCLPIGEL